MLLHLVDEISEISRGFHAFDRIIHGQLNTFDDGIDRRFGPFHRVLHLLEPFHRLINSRLDAFHRLLRTPLNHANLLCHRGTCAFDVPSGVTCSLIHWTFSFIVSTVCWGTTSMLAIVFFPMRSSTPP